MRHVAGANPVRGPLQAIDKNWTVSLTGEATPTRGADLVSLRRADLRLPPYPAGAQVVFANGDRLPGELLAIENDHVRFRAMFADPPHPDDAQELTIPLSAVAEIWWQPPPESDAAKPEIRERMRRDVVYLAMATPAPAPWSA